MSDPWKSLQELFALLSAVRSATKAERRRQTEARRKTPEAKAVRSRAAREGWEQRRAREEREQRELAAEYDRDGPVRTGPVCGQMNHNSVGREVFCQLEPGHHKREGEELCDDLDGTTWDNEWE